MSNSVYKSLRKQKNIERKRKGEEITSLFHLNFAIVTINGQIHSCFDLTDVNLINTGNLT